MADSEDDDWTLDFDKNRITRIKLKKMRLYKEAYEGYPNKSQKLAAYLVELEQECAMRESLIPDNIAKRDKAAAKFKRQQAAEKRAAKASAPPPPRLENEEGVVADAADEVVEKKVAEKNNTGLELRTEVGLGDPEAM